MAKVLAVSAVQELLAEVNDEALTADGFDDALIGYVQVPCKPSRALYDREKCIQILIKRDKMTRDVAEEYFDFNVVGAYVGENGPVFGTILRK